jgi:arylsulfatase A-like enzyme
MTACHGKRIGFLSCFVSLILFVGSIATAGEKPNVLVVLFDDLGYSQPSAYSEHTTFKMPHFGRLAKEGMRFTDAHSASAVCTPTRYGLLTGKHPSRIGQFGVLTTYSAPIIPPSRLTMASFLKSQGYSTACVGKWHLGWNWSEGKPGSEDQVPLGARLENGPNAVGFDYFCGFTHARNIGTVVEQDRVVAHVTAAENQPFLLEKALSWLDQQAGSNKPFFLYFPMCPPHTPVAPAPEFQELSGAEDLVLKDPRYGDWILQGDAMLGALLDKVEQLGLAESTLVIATSDNGAEHRPYPPLRDAKRSIYEGGHRVPFVARWPGQVSPQSTCDVTICLNDLFATVAEITGASLPESAAVDSHSILPLLLQKGNPRSEPPIIHQSMSGDLALRQGPWKMIFFKDGRRELYHLHDDLSETMNLLESQPEVARRLQQAMQKAIDHGRTTPGPAQQNDYPLSLKPGENAKRKRRDR